MKVGYLRYGKNSGPRMRCLSMFANMHDVDFFYFNPERIDRERKIIKGLFFDKKTGNFVEKETTYPDIIDDQPTFRIKYPELFKDLLPKSFFLFTSLNGKNFIYKTLAQNGYSKYLIETYNYKDIELDDVLRKHGKLVIKPNRSGGGQNIYKLSSDNDFYYLHFEHNVEKMTPSEFKEKYDSKFRNIYIVQNYIDSTTKQGNPFDVRVNARRGKNGAWSLRKMFVRIGSSSGVVSNIATGGSIGYYVNKFLLAEFGNDWRNIYDELLTIGKVMPDVMQRGYKDKLDDLGFDVAINRSNNELKFFEVNTFTDPITYNLEALEARFEYYMYLYKNIKELHSIQKANIKL